MKPAKPYNGGTWTKAQFHSFIKSILRAAWRRWKQRSEALKAARAGKGINEATGRKITLYKCAACSNLFKADDVQVDHIDPVVSVEHGFESWDDCIERMFCDADGYQVLCKTCHSIKTASERKARKENRNDD